MEPLGSIKLALQVDRELLLSRRTSARAGRTRRPAPILFVRGYTFNGRMWQFAKAHRDRVRQREIAVELNASRLMTRREMARDWSLLACQRDIMSQIDVCKRFKTWDLLARWRGECRFWAQKATFAVEHRERSPVGVAAAIGRKARGNPYDWFARYCLKVVPLPFDGWRESACAQEVAERA